MGVFSHRRIVLPFRVYNSFCQEIRENFQCINFFHLEVAQKNFFQSSGFNIFKALCSLDSVW